MRTPSPDAFDVTHLRDVPGVYRIVHTPTGDCYVGSTVRIRSRVREHFNALRNAAHPVLALQDRYDADGQDAFRAEVLELCEYHEVADQEWRHIRDCRPFFNGTVERRERKRRVAAHAC